MPWIFRCSPNNYSLPYLFPENSISVNRLRSLPKAMLWSWRSHSPPWSQMGQSRGWLTSKNSMTPSRAFLVISEFVLILQPFITGIAHAATGYNQEMTLMYFNMWSNCRMLKTIPSRLCFWMLLEKWSRLNYNRFKNTGLDNILGILLKLLMSKLFFNHRTIYNLYRFRCFTQSMMRHPHHPQWTKATDWHYSEL